MISLDEVRARFARGSGLPFSESLSEVSIEDALARHGVRFRDRIFLAVTDFGEGLNGENQPKRRKSGGFQASHRDRGAD